MEKVKVKAKVYLPVHFEGEIEVESCQDWNAINRAVMWSGFNIIKNDTSGYLGREYIDCWWTRYD